jgi:DNA polymerase (family X)
MEKAKVAEILDEIGTLLELHGENPFKCIAFHNAARIISGITDELSELVKSGEIRKIKGIGDGIARNITELIITGKSTDHEHLKSVFPDGIFQMLKIQGLGSKKVRVLFEKLQISSIDELEKAAKSGLLENLDGFGKKSSENILLGIDLLKKYSSKFLFNEAEHAAETIFETIKNLKGVIRAELAGSLRRKKETIGDIDIVVSAKKKDIPTIINTFTKHSSVERITGEGKTKSSVILKSGINCDLRIVNDSEFPFTLNYFTGSKEHNVHIRSLARDKGLSLNEYGFSNIDSEQTRGKAKKIISCKNENDIYKALDLQYIEPELREDNGEIELAKTNSLPELVSFEDIRGTFHCHTSYSDGRNTLLEMADAAKKLGWEYLGIADHSKVAAYANGLSEERVKHQIKEIDKLNSTYKKFRLFKGTEVDILADGTLDFSNKTLSSFEYVVASVHSNFKMNEVEMTKRIISAIKNKYVTIIGHLTGRLLLRRDSYPLKQKEIINAAADYGKVIEINAHPSRLDLDWRWCKYAKEKGVLIAINPDAHIIHGLTDVRYGIGIARKGWLGKKDIINTKSTKMIDGFFSELKK